MSRLLSKPVISATRTTTSFVRPATTALRIVCSSSSNSSAITTTTAFAARRIPTAQAPARGFHSTAANMTVHNISSADEFKDAISKHKVVFVDFYATWCAPCKAIAPKVAEWSEKFPNIYYVKVDVDEQPQLSQEYGISAMPTFLLFKDGEKTDEVIGANPPKLQALIEQHNPADA